MRKLLLPGWAGALAVAAAAYPAAWLLSKSAIEVWMITPNNPDIVTVNRTDPPEKDDPQFVQKVIRMYGIPMREPAYVLFVPAERLLHPEELPSLTLLSVDKTKNENPLQLQTVWFFAQWVTIGASAAGLVLLTAWLLLRRMHKA